MVFSDLFERFAADCPLPVVARATLENALNPRIIDGVFEDVADRQYTRKILFSSIVELMTLVVCRIRPAISAAYQARAETIDASLKAVYDKLDRTEPAIAAALVRTTAERLAPVIQAMGGARPELLPGYRAKILDGNHLAGTQHRIKELRTMRAGALPGQALVVLDPALMLAVDVIPCEDGHAQERSLLGAVLETLYARDLLIQDRNFCTTGFLFGIARRDAFFVVRQHASTLHWEFVGKRRSCGRVATGKVFEQAVRLTDPETDEVLIARRVTVVLDTPTRDGDAEIHLLTNRPDGDAKAKAVAELYRALDDRDGLRRVGGDAGGGGGHAGLSQGGVAGVLRGLGLVQHPEHGQGGVAFGPRRCPSDGGGLGLLRGRGGDDDASRDDDCHPGGRVGRVPGPRCGGLGRDAGRVGARGAASRVPKDRTRAEEAEAEEAEWGEDQACRHIQDPVRASKAHKMTPSKG